MRVVRKQLNQEAQETILPRQKGKDYQKINPKDNIPKELYNEWRQLFSSIDNQEQYNNEMCTPINETSDWFAEQQSFWKNISSTIRLTE